MFEHRSEALISPVRFARRQARLSVAAAGLVGGGLAIGAVGYHLVAGLSWVDSVYNAAMILTGMGPVVTLTTDGAKWFATCYALFSGVVFLTAAGLLLAPALHRMLHSLHLDEPEER